MVPYDCPLSVTFALLGLLLIPISWVVPCIIVPQERVKRRNNVAMPDRRILFFIGLLKYVFSHNMVIYRVNILDFYKCIRYYK